VAAANDIFRSDQVHKFDPRCASAIENQDRKKHSRKNLYIKLSLLVWRSSRRSKVSAKESLE